MKSTLQEMVRQYRSFTIGLLDGENREMHLWSPAGTSNHMIWHAGHSLWVQDLLCVTALTGKSELPEGWGQQFGQHCDPVAAQTDWPSASDLQKLLTTQQQRLIELIGNISDDQLVINTDNAKDLVGGIIHGLHDEGRHQGEMYLLLKQFKAAS